MEHLKSYVSLFIILAVSGIICIALQKIFPSTLNQKWLLKSSKLNFYYWLFNNFIAGYCALFAITLILTLTNLINPHLLAKIYSKEPEQVKAINVIIAIIAIDFIGYWLHRLFHGKKLWKFHAIHHSPQEIDWITSARFHPIESVIIVTITYILIVFAGIGIKTLALAFSIRATYGFIVHANLSWHYGPLGYIFASPYFHRWHHTKEKEGINKNFAGLFSAWDFIFKTDYHPKSRQPHNFGIHKPPAETFWQQLIFPFRK